MTPEIEAALEKASTLAEIEDIYRPFRPKRRTRASIAKEKGLSRSPMRFLLRLPIPLRRQSLRRTI